MNSFHRNRWLGLPRQIQRISVPHRCPWPLEARPVRMACPAAAIQLTMLRDAPASSYPLRTTPDRVRARQSHNVLVRESLGVIVQKQPGSLVTRPHLLVGCQQGPSAGRCREGVERLYRHPMRGAERKRYLAQGPSCARTSTTEMSTRCPEVFPLPS